ncbi:MAG: mechanosensitive ion channel domain-containing protein, partial [Candidatus Nanopelagicales bacterium]
MNTLAGQSWFWPVLAVVVGLPLALLILSELYSSLARRGSAYAKPVALFRNWLLPAGSAYLLIDQLGRGAAAAGQQATLAKIAATVVGFLIMLLLLSGANAALFGDARSGSWRQRLPGIFIDLGRLILIIIGIAILMSWVWGTNIRGLITAVGVTSIVIGLAVQNAVGPVISGLLLLFEQPFRLGDWLDTKFGRGRVVEVNWRAVHLDTDNGLQIVPNAALAGDAFINLSRTAAPYFKAKATLTFAIDDPPGQVKAALLSVAEVLPTRLRDVPVQVTSGGDGSYRVVIPVAAPADEADTNALMLDRAWYAAQRAGLHMNKTQVGPEAKRDYAATHLGAVAAAMGLDQDALATMLAGARVLPYAKGEVIQQVNSIPTAVGFITDGTVGMFVYTGDGRQLSLGELGVGDFIGATALTRQRMITGVIAISDTIVVSVPREAMNTVVQQDNRLARQIGETIELRRRAAR